MANIYLRCGSGTEKFQVCGIDSRRDVSWVATATADFIWTFLKKLQTFVKNLIFFLIVEFK